MTFYFIRSVGRLCLLILLDKCLVSVMSTWRFFVFDTMQNNRLILLKGCYCVSMCFIRSLTSLIHYALFLNSLCRHNCFYFGTFYLGHKKLICNLCCRCIFVCFVCLSRLIFVTFVSDIENRSKDLRRNPSRHSDFYSNHIIIRSRQAKFRWMKLYLSYDHKI